MTDPSFIYDERDRRDEELEQREPPLDWSEVEEEPPFAECATCSDLYMCQNLGFPESVEECELHPEEAT